MLKLIIRHSLLASWDCVSCNWQDQSSLRHNNITISTPTPSHRAPNTSSLGHLLVTNSFQSTFSHRYHHNHYHSRHHHHTHWYHHWLFLSYNFHIHNDNRLMLGLDLDVWVVRVTEPPADRLAVVWSEMSPTSRLAHHLSPASTNNQSSGANTPAADNPPAPTRRA